MVDSEKNDFASVGATNSDKIAMKCNPCSCRRGMLHTIILCLVCLSVWFWSG